MTAQKNHPQRFGDAAVRLGLVTQDDIKRALSRQFEYPYLQPGDSGLSKDLFVAYDPNGAAAEALRGLRAQLMLRWFKDQSKTLAVLGARANTGASSLAANLAIVFAQLGERTLLIDANFREAKMHRLFGLDFSPPGLSTVLAGRGTLKDVMKKVAPFENLSLLCAGAPPPNPQELLGRVNFSYLMETAPSVFDVVIVDAPPVLGFADAQLVAARTGACILASRRNVTLVSDLEKAKAQLAPSGAALLGAVMFG
jgi:chain length determinant protein tyrosine kinase EpsG